MTIFIKVMHHMHSSKIKKGNKKNHASPLHFEENLKLCIIPF